MKLSSPAFPNEGLIPTQYTDSTYRTVTETSAVVAGGSDPLPRVSKMAATIPPIRAAPPPTPSTYHPQREERTLGAERRVVSRDSGTENKLRVMIEGRNADEVNGLAGSIADAVRAEIGS